MVTLLLVLSCVLMAGAAAAGLLLTAEDQAAGPSGSLPSNGLSDLPRIEPR